MDKPATIKTYVTTATMHPSGTVELGIRIDGFGESRYSYTEGLSTLEAEEQFKCWLCGITTHVEGTLYSKALPTERFSALMQEIHDDIAERVGECVQIQILMEEINEL